MTGRAPASSSVRGESMSSDCKVLWRVGGDFVL